MDTAPIVNRVAQSTLVTFDLEEYYHPGERVLLDLADQLYQGLILREKEFRAFVKEHDWSQYHGKNVAITCSADAIVPTWAYMLVATRLASVANMVVFGDLGALEDALFRQALHQVNPEDFRDAKVVVKGCSHRPVPISAYVEITRLLQPVAFSLMYGEPCSSVPLYKKAKAKA
ncbi:DUF2480 family protein [Catalinimonas alkaloidigena]|nr:DUF2480 family protein [Catalinimonas alkaloidigena]